MVNSDIEQAARDWVAKRDWDGGSAANNEHFQQWLMADRRHQGAFLRAQAAWVAIDRARVLKSQPRKRNALSRRMLIGGGVAASAMAAGLAGIMLSEPTITYETGPGEVRRVQMGDGSTAVLNADTKLKVQMARNIRRVRLVQGDTWFHVAKDAARPFVVETDRMQVRAVGTAFAVRAGSFSTGLLVSEGIVDVEPVGGRAATPRRLPAGSSAVMNSDGRLTTAAMSLLDIERTLAWRDFQIALDGDTLRDAVEMFNRYNARKLIIADPQIGGRKLVGWFRIDDPEGFAKAASDTLDVQVRFAADEIFLARRPDTEGRKNF